MQIPKMVFNPNFQITPTIASNLLEIERHKEAINILPITGKVIASLRETARLMTTHYSTQIEGNSLTPEEVEKIAKGQEGGFPGRERDEKEVRNYFLALEYVEEQLRQDAPISEKLIRTIHSMVYKGARKQSPYREGQNVIKDGSSGSIVYMPPEAKDVASLMKDLTGWIDEQIEMQELPAPIIAALAHYQFATIHPYYDGNGRTARLLTTFILHKTGYGMKGIYSLEEYYAKNLQGYYNALTIGESHNYYFGRPEADVTPFLEYFTEGMAIAFQRVREKAFNYKEEQKSTGSGLEQVNSTHYQTEKLRELRPQQRQVLSLFQKSREVNLQEIADHLGINARSANGLIKKWLEQNFIQIENPSKKARTYILEKDWERIILEM
ncbi:Fic family protein [Chryseobacterium oryctis]|uniref:Fic family protein n=1 Tax=Chryseobacterium oryctis TaxID=2952618 RepID=A0ABT3HIT6_9FLAO|nr:Fic family protein [Chryseobacterium oryctis]MCW3159699.1 Fic family protein [Chryseobacterium oryctis]